MFVGKQLLLSWLNSALQLRLEKIEDVSARRRRVHERPPLPTHPSLTSPPPRPLTTSHPARPATARWLAS